VKSKYHMLAGTALTVLAFAPALAARAQSAPDNSGAINEVVVTATHTGATNLQKTAIAVDVVSGADLVKENLKNVKDLAQTVPSLTLTMDNVNPEIYIRGVGGNNGSGGDMDVSVYLDGVYLARPSVILESDFNDLDRVEVVEGPQGTLFGRNSAGGAINFISKAPPSTFQFQDTLNVGNYALLDEAVTVGGPIADNMQASLSFSHVQHDGYLHNVDPGVGDPDAANRTAVRAQLKWEPTADISNTVRVDYLYTHEDWVTNATVMAPTNYSPLQNSIIGNLHDVDMAGMPLENELSYGVTDEFNWKINDNLTLKSITAGRTDQSYSDQGDVTDVSFEKIVSQYSEYQISQEFNLINKYGPLSGVLGLYYFNENARMFPNGYFAGGNPENPNPDAGVIFGQTTLLPTISRAAFFQETYQITPTLGITVGGRYTEEHRTLNTNSFLSVYAPGYANNGQSIFPTYIADLNKDADAFTPKFAVNWQATPNALLYVSATNGYKSGGFNSTATSNLGASFGPERIWAYELGAKTDWFDHTLRVNVALFRYDWTGLQFSSLITPTFSSIGNAAAATINGLELNVISRPIEGLTLTAGATVLDSEYNNFVNYSVPGGLTAYLMGNPNYNSTSQAYNASGNQLIDAPKFSLNLSGQKDFDLANGADLFVRAEYQYTSLTYLDPTNLPISTRPAFSLVNASIGYSPAHSHWTIALWGKNLADTMYVNGFSAGSFVEDAVSDPRTFGVRVNYTY